MTTKFQNNFSMYYNSSTDKHKSIAFGYSSNIFLCESSNFCSVSLVNVKKCTFLDKSVKESLLYGSPNLPPLFLRNMKSWTDEKNPDMLGDFNINALCTVSYSNLRHMLTNFKLLVSQPTHLDKHYLIMSILQTHVLDIKQQEQLKIFIFQTTMLPCFMLAPTKTTM